MNTLGIIITLIICILVVLYVLGMVRTYKMEHGEMQEKFLKGTANVTSLDGDYKGIAHGLESTSWKGKTLSQADKNGINRIMEEGVLAKKYPFKFFVRKGLRDTNLGVIVLDYNQPGNTWWLKYIVDEMVEVAPQEYLGKVHVQITPKIVFTLGYFSLAK
ncbi:MAG: hypothetical protein AAB649_04485 [Patescibacteria group bacterium]